MAVPDAFPYVLLMNVPDAIPVPVPHDLPVSDIATIPAFAPPPPSDCRLSRRRRGILR